MANTIKTPVTSRGLLELGLDEHREVVSVPKRRLHDQALFVIYRQGVLTQNRTSNEVSIDAHGLQ